ncbi:MAG: hypothetical protein J6M60_05555 [Clostridia bacterium]|nr:hypothetical protein [Clostridia bacterium]
MENASKALIMAAEVLIGIIILSIGAALFTMFSNYSKDTAERISETKIAEFNNNFIKFYGNVRTYDEETDTLYDGPIRVSIHDIISVANLAKANNEKNDVSFAIGASKQDIENTMYVRVEINAKTSPKAGKYMELWTEEQKNEFIKNNSLEFTSDYEGLHSSPKYYKLKDYSISNKTNRVYYVVFEEI